MNYNYDTSGIKIGTIIYVKLINYFLFFLTLKENFEIYLFLITHYLVLSKISIKTYKCIKHEKECTSLLLRGIV